MRKHLPNSLTCLNLISGCTATYFAFQSNAKMALMWIIVGAVFDFFDGMAARLLGVSSPIGKELDSLADDITFGMAPAAIVFSELAAIDYPSFMEPARPYLPFAAFLIAAFSALRLAKFNIDTRQATSFIGMPTPANALFWGSFVVGQSEWIENNRFALYAILVLILATCWLLVSEIPMFSLKFKHLRWKDNNIKLYFSFFSVVMLIVFGWIDAWWLIISVYVLTSIVINTVNKRQGTGTINTQAT
ncbi:MAG: CDP-diacylglycerol--serine O-phosphatidyltransferase [Prevotella sp.]|nr:CDP-diacylglycerol--serine O-phosphatidyltransferase [Prevotella sp.]